MRTTTTARGVAFSELGYGAAFRFNINGHAGIGLKLRIPRDERGAALVLTPGIPDHPAFTAFYPGELGDQKVAELLDVEIETCEGVGAVVPGTGQFAKPGEIELHDNDLFLVFSALSDTKYRVDLGSGDVSQALGSRPAQIYTEWKLVRVAVDRRETLHQHASGDDQADAWNKPLDYSTISKGVV